MNLPGLLLTAAVGSVSALAPTALLSFLLAASPLEVLTGGLELSTLWQSLPFSTVWAGMVGLGLHNAYRRRKGRRSRLGAPGGESEVQQTLRTLKAQARHLFQSAQIKGGYSGQSPEEVSGQLHHIVQTIERELHAEHDHLPEELRGHLIEVLQEVVEDALQPPRELFPFSPLATHPIRLRTAEVELAPLLRARFKVIAPLAASRGISLVLDVEDVPAAPVDVEKLEEGVRLLAGYLFHLSPLSTEMHLKLSRSRTRKEVLLRLWLSGSPGAAGGALYPGLSSWDNREAQVALALAKELVELHGGRLDNELGPDETETFTIALPLLYEADGGVAPRARWEEKDSGWLLLPLPDARATPASSLYLSRVIAEIDANLHDSGYRVGTLALALSTSESQLKRRLRALKGCSPVELIRQRRLEQAARLLEKGAGTISEIGYATGFNSPSYFTKCFREHYGMTPSAYAQQCASR